MRKSGKSGASGAVLAMNDVQLYSTSFMARLFMVTERRVQQLTKEKVLPQVARGKYDIVRRSGHVRYLERIRSGTTRTSSGLAS